MLESVIACPNDDHGALTRDANEYVCTACGARYEIRNAIPVLLPVVGNG